MAFKIQLRRGNKVNLPTLDNGEPGYTQDTNELYIGSASGNKKLTFDADKYASYDAQLADIAIDLKNPPTPLIGAKDDGTDQSAVIQNIVNNYPNVEFKGFYTHAVPISIPSGHTLKGKGMDTSRLIYTGNLCSIDLGGNSHPSTTLYHITLENFSIQLEQDAIGIDIENAYHNNFDKVYVLANTSIPNQFGTGVRINGKDALGNTVPAYYNKFSKCIFSNLANGLNLMDDANANKFDLCEVYGCGTGLIIKDSNGNGFNLVTFQDFTVKAIEMNDTGAGKVCGNVIIGSYIEAKEPIANYATLQCSIHFTATCQFNYLIGNTYTNIPWSTLPNIIDDNPKSTNMRLEWTGSPKESLHFPFFATPPFFDGDASVPSPKQATRGGMAVVQNPSANDKLLTVLKDSSGNFNNYRLPLIKDSTNAINLNGTSLQLSTLSSTNESSIWYQTSAKKMALYTTAWKYIQDITADTTVNLKAIATSTLSTGQMAFSATLGKPVWWNGASWVDATGTAI